SSLESKVDYSLDIQSRVFVNSIIDLDLFISQSDNVAPPQLEQARFQSEFSNVIQSISNQQGVRLSIGSAAKNRSMVISIDRKERSEYLYENDLLFKDETKASIDALYSDRFSEDSHFLFQIGQHRTENIFNNQLLSNSGYSLDVTGAYVGIRTDYLGNSQIDILIGNSHQYAENNSQQSNLLSWNLKNRLTLTDNFQLLIGTERKISGSPDPSFKSVELTGNDLTLDWIFTEDIKLTTLANYKSYKFQDGVSASSLEFKQSILWRLTDYLSLGSSMEYQDFSGSRDNLIHDGLNFSVSVNWELF
ncbi:hypothetical protein N9L48_01355, partial [Psychrosphaera sp.]|nr:hypothetical protein [Psychrosphaera sp.]